MKKIDVTVYKVSWRVDLENVKVNPIHQIFVLACHFSCETCKGPGESNCLTCNSKLKRVFIDEKCKCPNRHFTDQLQTC